MFGPLTAEGLDRLSTSDEFRSRGLDVPSYPDGFRAEPFVQGPRAEGFLPVASRVSEEGLSADETLRMIQAEGFEIRAYSGALWYRPAIVSRMGQP